MRILEKEKFNMLIADTDKVLIDKEEVEKENPYYFKEAYIPKTMTLQECKEKFVEVEENI